MSMTDLYKVFDQTVREITREVNRSILKVPEIEQKTLDATSNEPWGPHGQLMNEIARATRNHHELQMIMAILWKRLQDTGANWRHVYKALVVMEFLVANGSERVIDELRDNTYPISSLQEFQYTEPGGKDQGINVRKKAQTLMSLLKDREKIREAREKAAANRNKYGGMSSSSYRSGGGGGGYDGFEGGSRSSDYDNYRSEGGGGGGRRRDNDDDSNGRRERDDVDRYRGRDEDVRGGGQRSGQRGGDWEEEYKGEGYARAGHTTLEGGDDDDFAPRGKEDAGKSGPAAGGYDDDWDDFDPRSSAKPTPAASAVSAAKLASSSPPPAGSAIPVPAPVSAPPAPAVDLLDLLGPDPSPAPVAAAAASASLVDPFAALSAPAPAAAVGSGFSSVGLAVPASSFGSFATAPKPSSPDFGDDDFGGFAAAPASASQQPHASSAAADPFGDPFAGFGTPKASVASVSGPAPALGKPSGPAKGGVWEDAISKGIVDLKISTGKEELTSLGIFADGLGTTPASLNPASNIPFAQQAGGMGRAMGTGSGKGIAGANILSPTSRPALAPGLIPPLPGAAGGLPPPAALGHQQQAAMGAFGPAGAFGAFTPGYPGAATGPGGPGTVFGTSSNLQGANLFPAHAPPQQQQQQQQQFHAFQF